MSYLVLARKWRPKCFAELVGQEHVVRALSFALDSGRVHHAHLFTGTRGVGKTTIARILAKSLNCERGVGASPCGECGVCTAVDAGRFIDLIEIDAASNTGVDDVRQLIESAQYSPSRGRFKVYLIDEVHMLSRNAFNALLKTLEEPPNHVKFLLATTDPQKLPVTVLSRCLQFNLRRLTVEQIIAQISHILGAEGVTYESSAVDLIAHAADGSLRDGLSLLDQAIAHGGGTLSRGQVSAMLGTVERAPVMAVLMAIAADNPPAVLAAIEQIVGFAPDFAAVLDELAVTLHRVQLRQLIMMEDGTEDAPDLMAVADQVAPELVQLWYQMATSGRRELPLAPSPRIGFEMVVLRMLAFRSISTAGDPSAAKQPAQPARLSDSSFHGRTATPGVASPVAAAPRALASIPLPEPLVKNLPATIGAAAATENSEAPPVAVDAARSSLSSLNSAEDWIALLAALGLKGPVRELAAHAQFLSNRNGIVRLSMPEDRDHLRTPNSVQALERALREATGAELRIDRMITDTGIETLSGREHKQRSERQRAAETEFMNDPSVRRLLDIPGARVVPDSIRPID